MIASGNSAAIANPLPGASPAFAAAAYRLPMLGMHLELQGRVAGNIFHHMPADGAGVRGVFQPNDKGNRLARIEFGYIESRRARGI